MRVKCVKITDFGLSKLSTPTELTFDCCGTPAYVAPEVLLKSGYRSQVDVWACGVILYSMVAKQLPFQSNDRKQTFKQIKEKNPDFSASAFTEVVSPTCIDLISKMLHKDPKLRISVADALAHPFFDLKDKDAEQLTKKILEKQPPSVKGAK